MLRTELDFFAYIAERTKDFTGREWVFAEIDRWLADPDASQIFLLVGEPGIGKTAIAARLTQFSDGSTMPPADYACVGNGFLSAVHFCSARNGGWISPDGFARSLSTQLAARYPAFADALASDPRIHVEQQVGTVSGTLIGVQITNYYAETSEALFNDLVRMPLQALCSENGLSALLTILVDGLDESLNHSGRANIVRLLAACWDLPPQVRLLLTSRPVDGVLGPFRPLQPFIPYAHSEENRGDVGAYVDHRFATSAALRDHVGDEAQVERVRDSLVARSGGNFLVVSKVLGGAERGELRLDDPEALPAELRDLYAWFLDRLIQGDMRVWRSLYRPVLGMLAVVQEPVAALALCGWTGLTRQQVADGLHDLREFLDPALDGRYRLYHESVVDFLTGDQVGLYYLDAAEYHHQIAARYTKRFIEDAEEWADCDTYGLHHLPTHLAEAGQVGDLSRLLMDLDFIEAKCFAKMAVTLLQDYSSSLAKFPEIAQQPSILKAVEGFQDFVRSQLHVLSTYPELTFQQALNQPEDSEVHRTVQVSRRLDLHTKPHFRLRNKHYEIGPTNLVLHGHIGTIRECMWSPTGGEIITAAEDGLRVWDSETGQLKRFFSEQKGLVSCKYSPDSRQMASAGRRGLVVRKSASGEAVWDVQTARIAECSWSPDGTRILLSYHNPEIHVWDADRRELMSSFKLDAEIGWVTSCSWSPDGTRILYTSNVVGSGIWSPDTDEAIVSKKGVKGYFGIWAPDGHAVVTAGVMWRAVDGEPITVFSSRAGLARHCDWSANGDKIAVVGNHSKNVGIWNAKEVQKEFDLVGHTDDAISCAFSPDGTRVLTCSEDTTLRVWDATNGELTAVLRGHTGSVYKGEWSPDGRKILSRSADRTCRIWDLLNEGVQLTMPYSKEIRKCLISPSGRRCLISVWKGKTEIWDMEATRPSCSLPAQMVIDCGWSPDEKSLYTIGSSYNSIDLWDPEVGEKTLRLPHIEVERAWIGPEMVVSGGYDHNLCLWEITTGQLVQTFMGHMGEIRSIVGSPDGKMLASGSRDGTVCLWQLESAIRIGGPTHVLRGTKDPIKQCQWSPDAKYLVSFPGSEYSYERITDPAPRLWDAQSGRLIAILGGHTGEVVGCAWSPEGSRLVSGAKDGTLRIWDGKNGMPIQTIDAHDAGVIGCCWSSDGRKIASVSEDLRLRIWDAESGECIASFFSGGVPTHFSMHNNSRDLVLGTEGGGVFFLEMKNVHSDAPIITPVAVGVSGGSGPEGSLELRCVFCAYTFPIHDGKLGKSLACINCGETLKVSDQVCEPVGPPTEDSVARALRNLVEYGKTLANELEKYKGQSQQKGWPMDRNLERFKRKINDLGQMVREFGDRRGEADVLFDLGCVYYKLEQMEPAIEYCEQALTIAQDIGDRDVEGDALCNLGLAYRDLGQVERARQYLKQALAIFEEIKSPHAQETRTELAELGDR